MTDALFDPPLADAEVEAVEATWKRADPENLRASGVLRRTFDQVYNGVVTGRYRWEQLYKTEKTHFGTVLEINLRHEFQDIITDGHRMDFSIAGIDVDCKYSQRDGAWMIPPEAENQVLVVSTAEDVSGLWSLGFVRASPERLNASSNRDRKRTLSAEGRRSISWCARNAHMPENLLASLDQRLVSRIFAGRSGQRRVNELLRSVLNRRISRNTIATVAQQHDYMKRVRANGGARSALAKEGILLLSGDYREQRRAAGELGATVPHPGELVSVRVVPSAPDDHDAACLAGLRWRLAAADEPPVTDAPILQPGQSSGR